MKKILAIVLTLALMVSLFAACSSVTQSSSAPASSTTQTPAAAETTEAAESAEASENAEAEAPAASEGRYPEVHVAVMADMEDLTPCKPNGTTRTNTFWIIYETLFDYDEKMNLVPNLAKSYEILSDTEWEVTLFETIHDSQGNPITADDVVYSVNWLVDSGNNIRYDLFDSIEKVDEYTVRYHWKDKPASTSDLEFPLCRTFIFDSDAWENNNFAVAPVATGPYVVESFTVGSTLIMTANENYWAADTDEDVSMRAAYHAANVDRIVYNTITESSQAVIGLEMGTIDFCDYVPAAMLTEFEDCGPYADQYDVLTAPSTDYYYILPNMAEENARVSEDLNLRLAAFYALDNETIAAVMGNNNVPLKSLGTAAYPDYDTAWEDEATYMNTYDPELAKDYLPQSNYQGEELVLIGLSTEECKNALTMIQNQLVQIGLNVKIQTYEKSFLLTVLEEKTGWDFYVATTGGTTLINSWTRIISQQQNAGWTAGWLKDDRMEELYAIAAADDTHIAENMKICLDYVMENGYAYGVSGWSSSIVHSTHITDICYREGYWIVGACSYQ